MKIATLLATYVTHARVAADVRRRTEIRSRVFRLVTSAATPTSGERLSSVRSWSAACSAALLGLTLVALTNVRLAAAGSTEPLPDTCYLFAYFYHDREFPHADRRRVEAHA